MGGCNQPVLLDASRDPDPQPNQTAHSQPFNNRGPARSSYSNRPAHYRESRDNRNRSTPGPRNNHNRPNQISSHISAQPHSGSRNSSSWNSWQPSQTWSAYPTWWAAPGPSGPPAPWAPPCPYPTQFGWASPWQHGPWESSHKADNKKGAGSSRNSTPEAHITNFDPLEPTDIGQAFQALAFDSEDPKWHMDTGASDHLCDNEGSEDWEDAISSQQ